MKPVSFMTSRMSVNGTRGNEFHRFDPSPHFTFRFAGRRAAARASVTPIKASASRRVIGVSYPFEPNMRKLHRIVLAGTLCAAPAFAQTASCDMRDYKPLDGLKAETRNGALDLAWDGARGQQLRASFTIRNGQPTVVEVAARKNGGAWIVLGRDLAPEFEVTSGKRRLSEQQMAPLRKLGVQFTPEVVDREKWFAFWDAPLMIPGAPNTNMDLPRRPEEMRRAWASYHASSCTVKSD